MSADIFWLGEDRCCDVALVGGKAANLSRLAARYVVPPGFCLTADLYRRTGGRELTHELRAGVVAAYRDLASRCGEDEPSVAVRSSAVDEDGAAASFAGQHETYLNVVGAAAVVEAIARCWESASSERALEYRRRQGLSAEGVGLAVLVQQLVRSDVSAVVFSANPLNGSRDEVVINASWGLGESIVGGSVTPDTWVVRKSDRAVISHQAGDKARMTIAVPGGTSEVDVPRFLRQRPALDDGQVVSAVELATTLEASLGWPVDVECAFAGGRLYLLQCRPITTLGGKTS